MREQIMVTVTMMVAMAVDAVALGEKVLYVEQMYLIINLTYMLFYFYFFFCTFSYVFFFK